jgi:hypothetical protein
MQVEKRRGELQADAIKGGGCSEGSSKWNRRGSGIELRVVRRLHGVVEQPSRLARQ